MREKTASIYDELVEKQVIKEMKPEMIESIDGMELMAEEVEKEISYGIKAEEIETTIQNEDGTETTVTETVKMMNPTLYSDYARFVDEASPYLLSDPE